MVKEIYPLLQSSRDGQEAAILDGAIPGKREGLARGQSIIGLLYMLWMTKRSMWTYIVCVVWFKVVSYASKCTSFTCYQPHYAHQ